MQDQPQDGICNPVLTFSPNLNKEWTCGLGLQTQSSAGLEIDLKRLEIEIKSKKTHAKKVLILPEKVRLQREIKELEKKRNETRQKLYQAQDKVDEQKEEFLTKTEAKLKQQSELKTLFTVKFKII